MQLDDYQKKALETDIGTSRNADANLDPLMIPLLGLAGEVGELLTEYKKQIRDGKAHTLHLERVREELGDLLWYLANCASKYGISLEEIGQANLVKNQSRWPRGQSELKFSDTKTEVNESFPPAIEAVMIQEQIGGRVTSKLLLDGVQIGATLTDNAYAADGYRFHDVFHLAYAAVLGWSPVIRALLKRKRKSNPKLDEVEDGGRAVVIEEGISALVFAYAKNHGWLEGVDVLDYELLRTIKNMTSHLEVRTATPAQWQTSILDGYRVWRSVMANGGGRIQVDTVNQTIQLI
jgi:NTP pyrophosphatase (non-canonical NTP hydrolase)